MDTLLVVVVLTNLWLLGSGRIGASINAAAAQGVVLGVLAVLIEEGRLGVPLVAFAVLSGVMKGVVFPWLLRRAQRVAGVNREIEPLVGYTVSVLAGVAALGIAMRLSARLPLPAPAPSALMVPVALFTLFSGLFLIVSRKKAITQVTGYLVMENGIYTLGMAIAREEPFLVQLGVLLDLFVGVFVMGIAIFHISREFDHIDTDQLSALKDTQS
ncbi:hydrogenase [bacterium]|nr:hydrogenase [bacterium]